MADTLLIHYSPSQPDDSIWSIANAEGELITKLTRGSISEAANFADNNKVVMLLDSNYVHLNQVTIPTKSKQKLLNAVPYALEEQLADEIEDLHFVIETNADEKKTSVACIAKNTLEDILSRCKEAGLELDALIPDALCLTADKNQWAILLFNESAYIQHHASSSLSIERSCYKDVLDHMLKREDTIIPDKIILFQVKSEESENIENEKLGDTEIIPVSFNEHPLVIFCGHYKKSMPLNLLQYEYKPVRKSDIQLKRWRLAASLAFLWLIIHLGNVSYQSGQLEASNQELRVQIVKIYKDTFPASKKIVNARVQMEQKLDELRSGNNSSDMNLISLLGDSHHAFTKNKDVTIKSIEYRNERLDITVTSTNLKSVELINKTLNTDTLKSEIISSTSEKNIVRGSLRIQRIKS